MACEYPGDSAEADQPDVLLDTLPVLVDRGVRLVLSLAANESAHKHTHRTHTAAIAVSPVELGNLHKISDVRRSNI